LRPSGGLQQGAVGCDEAAGGNTAAAGSGKGGARGGEMQSVERAKADWRWRGQQHGGSMLSERLAQGNHYEGAGVLEKQPKQRVPLLRG